MLSRERVIKVINHEKPDRIPIYGWVYTNVDKKIKEKYGSLEAFEDKFEFDLFHAWPSMWPHRKEAGEYRKEHGEILPSKYLEFEPYDPDWEEGYRPIKDAIREHKEKRGKFVYVQTHGIFESLNSVFGIENHLMYLMMYPEDLHKVYKRQAEWNIKFANNCIDLGVDMIHISDDWGAQNSLMFSPKVWKELIFPYHKMVVDSVKKRGVYVSLHSDGNIMSVLDGIVELGYNVVHPFQESAGMDFNVFKQKYKDKFVIMGGLDVQTTLGFNNIDFLKKEIERVMRMFADGGMIFCTSHIVQEHCSLEEMEIAFETALKFAKEVCK